MAEPILPLLSARFADAARAAFGADTSLRPPLVLPARDARHGDYTCSAPMALAKTLGEKPLALAERLAAAVDLDDIAEAPEVAPPGFVNVRLKPAWLAARVAEELDDPRLGVPAAGDDHVVVDYSAPNVAKEMHVGHLRSTIIGDCLANLLEHLGHRVDRISHVGDWGAQFGMLLAHLEDLHDEVGDDLAIADIEAFYRDANARDGSDPAFRERARQRVVELQAGEPRARTAWAELVELSRRSNDVVYDLLGITGLEERGESHYQPMLADVVSELTDAGLLVADQGAKVVFVDGFTNKDGDPLPLIVQNQHGGYGYATTDLAAIRHRIQHVGADRVLYVVDAGQSQHLEMVFAVARKAGWLPDDVEVVHVAFGLVLGEDGKRLRTRTGDNVKLTDLLTEAVDRASAFVLERAAERGDEPPADVDRVARVIGIGAVKYADLSQNRQSNYVFSYDRMLSLKGNTAPYLQYAYARMHSILREAEWADGPPAGVEVVLDTPQEVDLAKRLAELTDVLERVATDYEPNHLCAYLYDLSQAYNQFYEHCPVLRSDEPLRTSRLGLCAATASTLRAGLGLLGIEVLDRL